MGIMLANAERLAMEAMAAALEPPPPIDYLAWAEQQRRDRRGIVSRSL